MKSKFVIALASGALALGLTPTRSQAQTSVTTTPVGFISTTVPASPGARQDSRLVVSFPLQLPSVDAGAFTSVGTNTLTNSSANWTASQFVSVPYLVNMKSGASTGRYFLVTANTSSQLTLDSGGANLTTLVQAGDKYEIFPAHTFGNLFGTTSVPFYANEDFAVADNVLVQDGTLFITYFHDGTQWQRADRFASQNDAVIYPDESVVIVRRGTTPVSLTSIGAVPTTSLQTIIPGAGKALVANRFPVATTLKGLGLEKLPGWVANEDFAVADQVLFLSGRIWIPYWYDGNNWNAANSFATQDDKPIAEGTGYYIIRKANSTANTAVLNQVLPYTP